MNFKTLALLALLAPAALPQSGPPGGYSPNNPPAPNEAEGYDPTNPTTWTLPGVGGLACIPWPILPPPFPVPLPWWGP